MHPIRKLAIGARCRLQQASRSRRLTEMCERNEAPISVLFYHRVADCYPNDWTISTAGFRRSIELVQQTNEIISLSDAQRRIHDRCSPRPAVAITFDDGYAENAQFALPYLIANRIACTYFVSTHHVRHDKPFAHDVAAGQPLSINTIEQLRAASVGGVEIGLHTANHVDFSRVTGREEMEFEITDAKADLESMIDRSVHYFAVPFGMPMQMRPAVFETARQCGIEGVCSAYGAYNLVGNDAFHIRRIHGDPEIARLKNWLTFDARKCQHEPALPQNDILVNSSHYSTALRTVTS